MTIDLKIFYFLNNLAGINKIFDYFIIFLAEYLEYLAVLSFLVLLLLIKKYFLWEKIKIIIFAIGTAIFARVIIAEIIRFFYHRPRPFVIHPAIQLVSESSFSFPSGHAIFFFAFAAAIYSINKKIGVIFYITALIISLARIAAGVHYPSDILGGLLLGILTAILIKKIGRRYIAFLDN